MLIILIFITSTFIKLLFFWRENGGGVCWPWCAGVIIARTQALSGDKATQYDRQIRLWGVQAQKR